MEGLKLIGRRLKYKAHRVKIYEDELIKPDGKKVYYDFVENRNGSGVLLIDGEGRLILVKQFRNSISDYDIEIPAGCVEIDDNPVELENHEFIQKDFTNKDNPFYKCALREAEEETGLIPNKLFFINYIIAAVGLFSERTAVYIGTEINDGIMERDSDEYIDIIRLSLDEAMQYILDGKISDSKTIIAIQAYNILHNINHTL